MSRTDSLCQGESDAPSGSVAGTLQVLSLLMDNVVLDIVE